MFYDKEDLLKFQIKLFCSFCGSLSEITLHCMNIRYLLLSGNYKELFEALSQYNVKQLDNAHNDMWEFFGKSNG